VCVIPSQIAQELSELTATNRKGVEALYEAEVILARAESDLDKAEASAFIHAAGSVAERQAHTKLACSELRFERDLAKASVNRIRTKIRQIESELMAQATMAKIMQAEMKL
jgi:hypothetical protein